MIRDDRYFNFQKDIMDERSNGFRANLFYIFLCSAENELNDDYGEWFSLKVSDLLAFTHGTTTKNVVRYLKTLKKSGYIEVKDLHSDAPNMNIWIRIIPYEERVKAS